MTKQGEMVFSQTSSKSTEGHNTIFLKIFKKNTKHKKQTHRQCLYRTQKLNPLGEIYFGKSQKNTTEKLKGNKLLQ